MANNFHPRFGGIWEPEFICIDLHILYSLPGGSAKWAIKGLESQSLRQTWQEIRRLGQWGYYHPKKGHPISPRTYQNRSRTHTLLRSLKKVEGTAHLLCALGNLLRLTTLFPSTLVCSRHRLGPPPCHNCVALVYDRHQECSSRSVVSEGSRFLWSWLNDRALFIFQNHQPPFKSRHHLTATNTIAVEAAQRKGLAQGSGAYCSVLKQAHKDYLHDTKSAMTVAALGHFVTSLLNLCTLSISKPKLGSHLPVCFVVFHHSAKSPALKFTLSPFHPSGFWRVTNAAEAKGSSPAESLVRKATYKAFHVALRVVGQWSLKQQVVKRMLLVATRIASNPPIIFPN